MIKGIGHSAFVVKDMERTIAFYEKTLGFKKAFDIPRPENGEPWIVYMYVGGDQFVEFFYGVEIAAKEMIGVTVDEDGNVIAGVPGLVPTPTELNRFLRSDGQWVHVEGGGGGTSVEFTTTTAGLVDDVVYFFVKELPE